ncbi:hypothetical protein ACCT09_55430, partial [Rhizobium ruizarguesonis]
VIDAILCSTPLTLRWALQGNDATAVGSKVTQMHANSIEFTVVPGVRPLNLMEKRKTFDQRSAENLQFVRIAWRAAVPGNRADRRPVGRRFS